MISVYILYSEERERENRVNVKTISLISIRLQFLAEVAEILVSALIAMCIQGGYFMHQACSDLVTRCICFEDHSWCAP